MNDSDDDDNGNESIPRSDDRFRNPLTITAHSSWQPPPGGGVSAISIHNTPQQQSDSSSSSNYVVNPLIDPFIDPRYNGPDEIYTTPMQSHNFFPHGHERKIRELLKP